MRFRFEYTGIRTTDLETAVRFYEQGLGMKVVDRSDVPETGGKTVTLVTHEGGPRLELNWYPPGSPHASPYLPGEALDHLAFGIEGGSLGDAMQRLEKVGGKVRIEPFREGSVVLAYVDSPDGHTVELYEKPA